MKPSEFLTTIWTTKPPGLIHLWALKGRKSFYLQTTLGADVLAASHPEDLYLGVALAHRDHGRAHRTTNRQAAGIAGLWLDIDVNGGPDNKTGAARDKDTAIELAGAVLQPTLIVDSGYGIHAWWLFTEPWRFTNTDDQQTGQIAAAQWQHLHRETADFSLDATHDLARLLRLPGTANAKGGQRAPVEVLQANGPRYLRADLLERAATAGPITLTGNADVEVEVGRDASVDGELMALPEFAKTWRHDRTDHPDWTLSEYDLALCSIAAKHGHTDQQLADLIAAHRREHGDGKGGRPDYVERTIARVRTESPASQTNGKPSQTATYNPRQWAQHIIDMLQREDEGTIPLPFAELTEAMDGGLRPGELVLVAGYTGHGKSIVVDQIADKAADHGRRVHVYMTEMTAFQRGLRLLARRARIPFRRLKRRDLTSDHWQQVMEALSGLPYGCSIVSDWTVEQMVDHIRENRWDLAVVDLVHGFHYTDERELSKTSSVLMRATKGSSVGDHPGTTIVAAAHLNDGQMRDSRNPARPRPGLHSIKGSSSLKQDADVVMFVWQQDDDEGRPTGKGAVWLAKCRQGELDGLEVRLDTAWMRFVPDNDGVIA